MNRPAFLLSVAILWVAACSETAEPRSPEYLLVGNPRDFLEVGDEYSFQAVWTDDLGRAIGPASGVRWSSAPQDVLTIDQSGRARARSPGTSTVTASARGMSMSWDVRVVPKIVSVVVSPSEVELLPGDRGGFQMIPFDRSGTAVDLPFDPSALAWFSSDSAVTRLTETSGYLSVWSVLQGGTVTITADLLGRIGRATLKAEPLQLGEVAVGGRLNCALGVGALPYCWGEGMELLGLPTHVRDWARPHVPHRPGGVPSLLSITTGGQHACGLTVDQQAMCWGSNASGALGIGIFSQPDGPVSVSGGLRFTQLVAGGAHVCGIATDRRTWCWGDQLATANSSPAPSCGSGGKVSMAYPCHPAPVTVNGLPSPLTTLSAGARHVCGLDGAGRAWCWGLLNSRSIIEPELVDSSLTFTHLASGGQFSCGLTPTGLAYCWGGNRHGQLGDGTTTSRDQPAPVAGNHRFVAIAASRGMGRFEPAGHACGLTADGALYCWGQNEHGQLGTPPGPPQLTPVPGAAMLRLRSVGAGEEHTCGQSRDDGLVYCWGDNTYGQLGVSGPATHLPVAVTGQLVPKS